MELGNGLVLDMEFSKRLAGFRKEQGLTQQALADRVGVHVIQIHRYESGASQPSLEVIKGLAIALSITTDSLLFDHDERGPSEKLKLQFEAIQTMNEDDKMIISSLINAYIKKQRLEELAAS